MPRVNREFLSIFPGQVWSVIDNHRSSRRHATVINTTDRVNDPTEHGERVKIYNTESGRHGYLKASTLRTYWQLEAEAGNNEH